MGSTISSIKTRRAQKKADKANSQSLPAQQQADIDEGLADEHLASVPPPRGPGRELEVRSHDQAGGAGDITNSSAAPKTNPEAQQQDTITPARQEGKQNRMASDEDYTAFLDKANQDPSEGSVKTQGKGKVELKAVGSGVEVPKALQKAVKDQFYVSDADEPFEVVALKLQGKGLPDEAAFAKLVSHPSPSEANVEILDIAEWDHQGQYKELVDATREVSKGSDVRVYRIERDGRRVEYWLVGVEEGKLVGVKALAIES